MVLPLSLMGSACCTSSNAGLVCGPSCNPLDCILCGAVSPVAAVGTSPEQAPAATADATQAY
jgi:hypothetical protein